MIKNGIYNITKQMMNWTPVDRRNVPETKESKGPSPK